MWWWWGEGRVCSRWTHHGRLVTHGSLGQPELWKPFSNLRVKASMHLLNRFGVCFFFWLCWVVIAVHGHSPVAVSGDYSLVWYRGFPLQWLLLLWNTGSVVLAHGLRCSTACGIFPGPGIKPMSPALAGGFCRLNPWTTWEVPLNRSLWST